MTGYLLDTNVISELSKKKPEPRVTTFIGVNPLDNLYLSEVTLAEIRFGIEKLSDALKRSAITSWLDHVLRPMFQGRILPVTEDIILRWRLMVEAGRQRTYLLTAGPLYRRNCRSTRPYHRYPRHWRLRPYRRCRIQPMACFCRRVSGVLKRLFIGKLVHPRRGCFRAHARAGRLNQSPCILEEVWSSGRGMIPHRPSHSREFYPIKLPPASD